MTDVTRILSASTGFHENPAKPVFFRLKRPSDYPSNMARNDPSGCRRHPLKVTVAWVCREAVATVHPLPDRSSPTPLRSYSVGHRAKTYSKVALPGILVPAWPVTSAIAACNIEWAMTEVTRILSAVDQGDAQAAEQLLPLVYDELRRLAAQKLSHEKPGQTLQAPVT
jgi:hypothetical protein